MRKILLTILTLTLILVSLNTMVFAANETVYFGDGSGTITATSDTVVVPVYVSPSAEMIQYKEYGIGGVTVKYSVTNATESAAGVSLTNLTANMGAGTIGYNAVIESGTAKVYTGYTDSTPFVIANITVTRTGDAESSVLSFTSAMISDGTYPYTDVTSGSAVTISWPSAGPTVSDATVTSKGTTLTDNAGNTWKDVYVYEVSAEVDGVDGTPDVLTCALEAVYDGGTKDLGSYDVKGYFDGTVTFRAAIANVPSTITITGLNADFSIE